MKAMNMGVLRDARVTTAPMFWRGRRRRGRRRRRRRGQRRRRRRSGRRTTSTTTTTRTTRRSIRGQEKAEEDGEDGRRRRNRNRRRRRKQPATVENQPRAILAVRSCTLIYPRRYTLYPVEVRRSLHRLIYFGPNSKVFTVAVAPKSVCGRRARREMKGEPAPTIFAQDRKTRSIQTHTTTYNEPVSCAPHCSITLRNCSAVHVDALSLLWLIFLALLALLSMLLLFLMVVLRASSYLMIIDCGQQTAAREMSVRFSVIRDRRRIESLARERKKQQKLDKHWRSESAAG